MIITGTPDTRPARVDALKEQIAWIRKGMDEINGTLDRLEAAVWSIVWAGFEDETGRFHRDTL